MPDPRDRDRDVRERDIPVAPNEYAYVQDLTKGDVMIYVGPCKISLTNTERLVEFDKGRFRPLRGDESSQGVCQFMLASSSQYVVLENPTKDPNARYTKGNNSAVELVIGKKVVKPGPATFALWPGQRAQVINGHSLREDQYLLVRVYDKIEDEATDAQSQIGTERIIRGSDTSFYIPKTGLEVVPEGDKYVRNAVTLLDGEYCILQAPNGQRKYFRGPAVVFPEPMEQFITQNNSRVFKAHVLRKNSGLHVRVVKDVSIEAGTRTQLPPGTYVAGQEIFLKDKEGFFFPTEHLEVVASVSAIPINEKEGVYVRDIESGRIRTETGPKNYLPDPTKEEVIQRTLSDDSARLFGLGKYDPSRAVAIYIPPSMAVLVLAQNKREVVKGPQTRVLNYDEDLEVLRLSMGKPKNDDKLLPTCFLQIDGNKVSDIVRVKTSDHVDLELLLSYRVSFHESDSAKWFNVKNYVGLMCDHLGSIVRSAVRTVPVEDFLARSIEMIRNTILGTKQKEEKRSGRHFAENGMVVYDVEVLDVKILNDEVRTLLAGAQKSAIVTEVKNKEEELRSKSEKKKEEVNQQLFEARRQTLAKEAELAASKWTLAEAQANIEVATDHLLKTGKARNEAEALNISSTAKAAAAEKELDVTTKGLQARVAAFKDEMAALHPELVATLRTLGNQQLAAELTKHLSPLAILGGESVADIAERLLKALPLGLSTEGVKALAGKNAPK